MESKIYKQDYRDGVLNNNSFITRDYFKYYTTGIEELVYAYPTKFNLSTRRDAERPENIMYSHFNDANLSDMFVAINNQNYLWATPFGLDAFQDAIEFRMNYVELLMRDRIVKEEILDADSGKVVDTIYNNVGDKCYEKTSKDIHDIDDTSRTIIIPEENSVQFVSRKIREYLDLREVK